MANVTCPHCETTTADWLLDCHECRWIIWRDGGKEEWAREWRGRDARDAATSYAFYSADYEHRSLCDVEGSSLTVNVRRKGSDEVARVRITGHWQPTYAAYVEKTSRRKPKAA